MLSKMAGERVDGPLRAHVGRLHHPVAAQGEELVYQRSGLLTGAADGEQVGQPTLVSVGAGLAALPWLHTRFVILAAMLGLAVIAQLATRRIRPTRLAAFLFVPAVSAAAWFAFFWIIWGTPNPMAPYGRDTESSLSYIGRGLSGLLFDQQHGVLATAPVYVVALLGLRVRSGLRAVRLSPCAEQCW